MANEKQSDKQTEKIGKEMVEVVQSKVQGFCEKGELNLPANYSAGNALRAAWLIIQKTEDRNHKPALEACTRESVFNSLLDMVVQGLNPIKKQGYFIVYGDQLVFQRSYFGSMHLCKELTGANNVYGQAVYADDEFEYTLDKGHKRVINHTQKIENVDNAKIVAAYCTVEYEDATKNYTDIMTIAQIRKAWSKSKTGQAVHNDFTEEMAKKTVINRACKALINSSNDSYVMLESLNRTEATIADEAIAGEIEEKANTVTIDIQGEVMPEEDKRPEPQAEPVKEQEKESAPKTKPEPPKQSTMQFTATPPFA
jgi:Recombinational DNA repair protein (RecE pathway)